MAKIAFFGLEKWENQYLKRKLRKHETLFDPDPLSEKNAAKYKDADIIGTFIYSKANETVLKKFPKVKLIVTLSTGYDHVNLKVCKKRKITVCNVPTYGANTVAEHTMGLLLNIAHNIVPAVNRTRKGNFSNKGLRGFDLRGKTIGIMGTGNIGTHMTRYAKAFGMNVIAFDKFPNKQLAKECDFDYVPLNKLLKESDIISLHLPLTKETKHIINKRNVKNLKKGCVIINTARGGLIDTDALLTGLKKKTIKAAGLDVLEQECAIKEEKEVLHETFQKKYNVKTLLEEHWLREMDNVFITPHNAFNSEEALYRILDITIENIESFLEGKPKNIVSE